MFVAVSAPYMFWTITVPADVPATSAGGGAKPAAHRIDYKLYFFISMIEKKYRQVFNIRRTLVGN